MITPAITAITRTIITIYANVGIALFLFVFDAYLRAVYQSNEPPNYLLIINYLNFF
jgi:hypothetical protein